LFVVWVLDGENIFDCMMKMLSALAYPVCCMVVLYVVVLLAMIINLIDGSRWTMFSWPARKWRFRCLAIWAGFYFRYGSLGLRPMYCIMPYSSTIFSLDFYLVSVGIVVCLVCRGCVRTQGLLYITILCDVSFNFA